MTLAGGLTVAELPLRERKKLKTRRMLIMESQRLFLERGYRATTLEDIAAAAEVTVQTLLRYFPTKEDLALALEHQAVERLRKVVEERPPGQTVLGAWVAFLAEVVSELQRDPTLVEYLVFLQSDPSLSARALEIIDRNEELLATSLAAEAGVDVESSLMPWSVAAVAVHGFKRVHRLWIRDATAVDLHEGLAAVGRLAESLLAAPEPVWTGAIAGSTKKFARRVSR